MREWLRNLVTAIRTVLEGMSVTLRVFGSTYDQKRRTFTEHYEYPELPAPVAARYRGFHRYDLTTCIACDQCAKACPVDCIYIGKERVENGKGFQVSGFTIDYSKCMFCALCVEPCPVDCIFMGSTLDLSCYSRDGTIVDFARLPVEVAWGLPAQRRLEGSEVPLRSLPLWVGIDRALAGWGAWRRQGVSEQGGAVLVADAGTVLSLTRVDGRGQFQGGRLLAGVALQLRAMAQGTAALPDRSQRRRAGCSEPGGRGSGDGGAGF
jgi:NADH-quinone oxidoreductase subunit I